ncbi:GNAT family N-acetyltransferase [Rhodococcus ruber]|uniref:GNAT family N-acetyltransferase n=1 Tax=Rhodococcus ruber TaxID=1830 RepID=A0ABT4M968_9NOCA|nr:GNAT family N-acetyltransferase [Rhodococcus ruber]MCZ4517120.1 GNAT family N-acetyltransferase [Rhodococcus ruber]
MSGALRAGGMALVHPSHDLRDAWLDCRIEWGPGLHEDGFGLTEDDDVDSAQGFSDWIDRIRSDSDCTYRWMVEGRRVVGGIAVRHGSAAEIERLGHLGYGVRPSDRGRGVATQALVDMLEVASEIGLSELTAVCEVDNRASVATLEGAGGELLDRHGATVRYRIRFAR